MKKSIILKLFIISLFTLTAVLAFGFKHKISASAQWCYMLVPATSHSSPPKPSDCLNYGQTSPPNALTNLEGLSGNKLINQFVSDLNAYNNSSDKGVKLSATFITDWITGGKGSLSTTITAANGWSVNIQNYSWTSNSAYDPYCNGGGGSVIIDNGGSSNGCIVEYPDIGSGQGTTASVVLSDTYINNSGQKQTKTIRLKLDCGNIMDYASGSPPPAWFLTGQSSVSNNPTSGFSNNVTVKYKQGDSNVSPTYFSNSLTNSGPGNTTQYTWTIVQSGDGNGLTGSNRCGSNAGTAIDSQTVNNVGVGASASTPGGQYGGDKGFCSYEFPSNAKANDTYCQYIKTDHRDPNGDPYSTTKVCVTYKPSSTGCTGSCCSGGCGSQPATFSATCTNASVGMPSAYYNSDPTGRFALYESAVTGPVPTWSTTGGNGSGVYSGSVNANGSYNWPSIGVGAMPNQPGATDNPTYDIKNNFLGFSSATDYGYSPGQKDNSGTTQYMVPSATAGYTLSSSQIASGSITWYVVVFNASTSGGAPKIIVDYSKAITVTCYNPVTCSLALNPGQGVLGSSTNNNVESGQPFTYTLTINNGDPNNDLNDPFSLDNGSFNLYANISYQGGGWDNDVGTDIPAGSSDSITIGSNAPNDTSPYTMTAYVGYNGVSGPGMGDQPGDYLAACSISINDYAQFQYTPSASLTLLKSQSPDVPGSENPKYVKKTFSYAISPVNGDNLGGQTPSGLNITGYLYYVPAGNSPYDTSNLVETDPNIQSHGSPYTPTPYYTITQSLNAGDAFCIQENIVPGSGYIGPGGSYLDNNGTPDPGYSSAPTANLNPPNCSYIYNEPYASFTGNDVIGDTSFGLTCGQPSYSGIYTNSTDSSGSYASPNTAAASGSGGSASQFGAEAVDIIEGLTSSSLGGSAPSGPMGLSFANGSDSGAASSSPDGNPMGGEFGYSSGGSTCEPDYYDTDIPLQPNRISLPSNVDGAISSAGPVTPSATNPYNGLNYATTGSITIGTGVPGSSVSVQDGAKVTIFVSGNVYIDSNIIFANAGSGWPSITDIPSFYIIARGNIYIAPNVTQLDGVYIAQPTSSSSNNSGVIDTCASNSGLYGLTDLYGDGTYSYTDYSVFPPVARTGVLPGCNNQLTVNGAFVDQATLLDRSFSSLRYSKAGENTISSYPARSCGGAGHDVNSSYGGTQFSDCAAEIFNFTPEVYLSQPSFQPASGPEIGKYNYITSLSPVL